MNDLISKRMASNELKKYQDLVGIYDKDIVAKCIRIIKDMPSAQPEPEEFEWCHDCKEYDQEAHCCHRWTKVIRNTVEEIKNAQPERKKGKWKVYNILDYAQRPTGRRVGECSVCGYLTDDFRTMVEANKELTNFCPKCGSFNKEVD